MSTDAPGSLPRRLAWFFGLWGASVITIGTVAYFIRWWIV